MAETQNLGTQAARDDIRRNENDFSPGPGGLPTPTRNGSTSSPKARPTRQLDFNQAMSDFKTMFPNMDVEIIEAVLRTNNGIVDATIDQLLTMSIDNEVQEQTHVHWSPDMPIGHSSSHHHSHQHNHHHHRHNHHHREHGHSRSKSKRSSKQLSSETNGMNGTKPPAVLESPPSYSEAIQAPQAPPIPTESTRSRSHSHTNAPRKSALKQPQPTMLTTFRQASDPPSPRDRLLDLETEELELSNTDVKTPITSSWNSPILSASKGAPLWGSPATMPDLPDHISCHSIPTSTLSKHSKLPPYSSKSSASAMKSSFATKYQAYKNWNPPLLGNLPDDFLRLTTSVPVTHPSSTPKQSSSSKSVPKKSSSVKRSQSERHVRHHSQPTRLFATHDFSSDMLQEKIKENERRRRMTCHVPDPELAQYLADERLALVIQNSEFLQELRENKDFMTTLESDRMNASAFEPTLSTLPSPASPPATASSTSDDEAKHVGYGEDNQTTLEAFPFSHQLPPKSDRDEELRTKLKHMGKASKKQFVALARRFTSIRRKRTPRQILKEQSATSTANLLDSETDESEVVTVERTSYDDPLTIEPLPSALNTRQV